MLKRKAPIGVEVDCDQSTININVHPEQNQPVTIACTVKNTGSFAQDISLESEVEGNDFSLTLSEDSLTKLLQGKKCHSAPYLPHRHVSQ